MNSMKHEGTKPSIASYRIVDSVDHPAQGAVEVDLELTDGRKRWCYFFTPQRLSLVGDWVAGTKVRIHLGASHMIVVSELSADIIERVLRELESTNRLLEHTRAVDNGAR
jgi:hypothetical protein